jgi:hypothetical protein
MGALPSERLLRQHGRPRVMTIPTLFGDEPTRIDPKERAGGEASVISPDSRPIIRVVRSPRSPAAGLCTSYRLPCHVSPWPPRKSMIADRENP